MIDRSWLLLAATIPFWSILMLGSHGFVAPDVCFAPTGAALERFMLGLGMQFGWAGAGTGHFWTWCAMIAAMSLPVVAPMAQYVAVRSFPERRWRSVTLFLAGYGMLWILAFPIAITFLTAIAVLLPRELVGFGAYVVTAAWYGSPASAWTWRRRHRTSTIVAQGARADISAITCGLHHGLWCASWCAPLMIAAFPLHNHVAAMALSWPLLLMQQVKLVPPIHRALVVLAIGALFNGLDAMLVAMS